MTENIDTSTAIVKTDVSTAALSDAEFAYRLEAIARDIDTFERERRRMIFRIANYHRHASGRWRVERRDRDCAASAA